MRLGSLMAGVDILPGWWGLDLHHTTLSFYSPTPSCFLLFSAFFMLQHILLSSTLLLSSTFLIFSRPIDVFVEAFC